MVSGLIRTLRNGKTAPILITSVNEVKNIKTVTNPNWTFLFELKAENSAMIKFGIVFDFII